MIKRKCEGQCQECDSKIKMVRISKDLVGYQSVQTYCANAILIAQSEGYSVKDLSINESKENQYSNNEALVA